MTNDIRFKKIEDAIENISKDLREIVRRLDSQDRYLELIYKDRELLNDVREGQAGLRQRVLDHAEHVESIVKDSEAEITKKVVETQDVVEDTGQKTAETVVKGVANELTEESNPIKKVFKK